MTLALDLGNSALKAACFSGDEPVRTARFETARVDWAEEFSAWLAPCAAVRAAGLASVVPSLTPEVAARVSESGLPAPISVNAAMPLPLRMAYATPATLGADRLAAAVAAWLRYGRGRPVIVVDAGTAVTYEAVTAGGTYLGGAIAPGPELLTAALARGTAQLPRVPFEEPSSPIGDGTLAALQSGLVYGFLGGVEAMLGRLKAQLGRDAQVVATGGWAAWIANRLPGVDAVRPLLVLEGVRDLVRHAQDAGALG